MIDEQLESMFESLVSQSETRLDRSQIPGDVEAGLGSESSILRSWHRFAFPLAIAAVAVVGVLGVSLVSPSTSSAPSDQETTTSVSAASQPSSGPTAGDVSATPISVRLNGETRTIETEIIQRWVGADVDPANSDWSLDQEQIVADLELRFDLSPSEVTATVVDGELVAVPGQAPVCCQADTTIRMAEHLLAVARDPGLTVPVRLETEIQTPAAAADQLGGMGIVEEVSSFTTNHPCCANRVINIQRIAELMNGVVIEPNSTLSLNEQVGRRTTENGFVADGVIVNGQITTNVGGGVSQYATTLFNAWFFAGLEFEEYQSHSAYISRYPQGRDASLSFPKPDLVVRNQTDYAVLIWSESTDTSITVSVYSTKHIETTIGEVVEEHSGECWTVTTPRSRQYTDGTIKEDSISAIYRNSLEGDAC